MLRKKMPRILSLPYKCHCGMLPNYKYYFLILQMRSCAQHANKVNCGGKVFQKFSFVNFFGLVPASIEEIMLAYIYLKICYREVSYLKTQKEKALVLKL